MDKKRYETNPNRTTLGVGVLVKSAKSERCGDRPWRTNPCPIFGRFQFRPFGICDPTFSDTLFPVPSSNGYHHHQRSAAGGGPEAFAITIKPEEKPCPRSVEPFRYLSQGARSV